MLVNKTYTFSSGAVISASEHNTNFDTLYTLVNGNINNDNIVASAGIVDTKLAQITTASKVSGASITLLSSVPSGAGYLPVRNIGVSVANDTSTCAFTANVAPSGTSATLSGWLSVVIGTTTCFMPYWERGY